MCKFYGITLSRNIQNFPIFLTMSRRYATAVNTRKSMGNAEFTAKMTKIRRGCSLVFQFDGTNFHPIRMIFISKCSEEPECLESFPVCLFLSTDSEFQADIAGSVQSKSPISQHFLPNWGKKLINWRRFNTTKKYDFFTRRMTTN